MKTSKQNFFRIIVIITFILSVYGIFELIKLQQNTVTTNAILPHKGTVLADQLSDVDAELFLTCARNALYMYVTLLSNKDTVHYADIKKVVPVKAPYGTSYKALLQAAKERGYPSEVRLYNLNEPDSVPLPAIVQTRAEINGLNHFDVLYKRDSKYLHLLHGTTAASYRITRSRFCEGSWWTGYALIEKRSKSEIVLDNYWPHITAILLIVTIYLLTQTRHPWQSGKHH